MKSKGNANILSLTNRKTHISAEIEESLKKYDETYRLLEEYENKSIKDPTVLANPGRLQITISSFHRSSGS